MRKKEGIVKNSYFFYKLGQVKGRKSVFNFIKNYLGLEMLKFVLNAINDIRKKYNLGPSKFEKMDFSRSFDFVESSKPPLQATTVRSSEAVIASMV